MKKLGVIAAIGAVIGSLLRYLASTLIDSTNFPWATFTVNIVGSLLIGLFLALPAIMQNEQRRVFLITGVLGGFTTFSALAVESLQLSAQLALLYIFGSFFLGTAVAIMANRLAAKT